MEQFARWRGILYSKYKNGDSTVLFGFALFIRCISEDYQQSELIYIILNKIVTSTSNMFLVEYLSFFLYTL